jgi:quinol monooxygenase YgiN
LNVDDPKNYVMTEIWDSKEHYEQYLAFRTEDGTVDNITRMSEEGPVIRIFDIKEA